MIKTKKYIDGLSELQKFVVLLLSGQSNIPIKGNTWIQKELFLLSQNIHSLKEEAGFESDFYGPYSECAEDEINELELDETIKKEGNKMELSSFGRLVALELRKKVSKKEIELVEDFKSLLNDLGDEELLTFIYFSYPDYTDESWVKEKIVKKRVSNAIKLFKKNKISMQKAAEISGEALETFSKKVNQK